MKKLLVALLITTFVVMSGCSDVDLALTPTRATIGYTTAVHKDLVSLPEPKQKVIVAVYKFRDQTGQYKTSAAATTFSTAVTQGATSMLNKALEDSGWFDPIEREGLANLLNERKIITSTRLQAQAAGAAKLPPLPPLLYAGVLLEGGIIGYDTNLVTGGLGVRYFGVGGSGKMRKDRVTIYLRLISVQNGQVLKSVSTTKSVLSREVDFGVYRFVSVQRLLEVETGLSTNEPASMCVLEAIEKAVCDLIIEGIQEGLWELKNPADFDSPAIRRYFEEKGGAERIVTFDKQGNLTRIEDIPKSEPTSSFLQDVIGEFEVEDVEQQQKSEPEPVEEAEPEILKKDESKPVADFLREVIGKAGSQDAEQPEPDEDVAELRRVMGG